MCVGYIDTNGTPRGHFDQDIRDLVQVRVVHGSWKRDDSNGIHIEVIRAHPFPGRHSTGN